MAGLGDLASMIYHEKQQAGSMLCAQHALNSLLQGNYFTAPDLSDIARNLDTLEQSYDDNNAGTASTNMDDTGFFSVQVLDNGLKVWGLNLSRWRGEDMRPYQDHPHTQLAFILNYQQHWFTLRRFGPAVANVDLDPGDGHWFNLNSFLPAPEWVGKLYLGMVLQQAEADGYSVFAVTQADPSGPFALPRTYADEVASTLPEPTSASRPTLQSITSHTTTSTASSSAAQSNNPRAQGNVPIDLGDEEYELQAALQASLTEGSSEVVVPPLAPPPLVQVGTPSLTPLSGQDPSSHTPTQHPYPVMPPHSTDAADVDPVAASMERSKFMLQRMREQQEFAQRELWAEGGARAGVSRVGRMTGDDDEEEMLRRAIAESEALAKTKSHGLDEDEDEDGDEDEDAEGDIDFDMDEPLVPPANRNEYPTPPIGTGGDRVYDDDDAELQAALKESLEHVPQGWVPPELQNDHTPPLLPAYTSGVIPEHLSASPSTGGTSEEKDRDDVESVLSEGTSTTEIPSSDAVEAVAEAISVDEIRRKRLAKFVT